MRSFLLRFMIGAALLVTVVVGGASAHAALITRLDIGGGGVDLNFGLLGHVGGTFHRDGLIVMGQYQPTPDIFSPVSFGPWTFSIFTSGAEGVPPPVASGMLDSTDGFRLSWFSDLSGSGVPFLQSAVFSLHGRAQVEPVPVPAAVILFGSGLFGIVGVVARRDGRKKQESVSGSDAGWTSPTGSMMVVVVSCDDILVKTIEDQLGRAGYRSCAVSSMINLCSSSRQGLPSMVLVDRRVADWDRLRTDVKFRSVPMMIVVALGSAYHDDDLLSDLERGADGVHLCREGHRLLVAKVGAYLRRTGHQVMRRGIYRQGAVELDTDIREVTVAGERVRLSAKPFAILEALMRAPSKLFSRSELIDLVWGPDYAIGKHALDVHVHALRKYLDRDPNRLCKLITVKSVGLKLKTVAPSSRSWKAVNPSAASLVMNTGNRRGSSPSENDCLARTVKQRRIHLLGKTARGRHLRGIVLVE